MKRGKVSGGEADASCVEARALLLHRLEPSWLNDPLSPTILKGIENYAVVSVFEAQTVCRGAIPVLEAVSPPTELSVIGLS